jgi:hypothetical protein
MGEGELVLKRAGGGHRDLDSADAEPHQRADLEQLEADRAAGGLGELGVPQGDAPTALADAWVQWQADVRLCAMARISAETAERTHKDRARNSVKCRPMLGNRKDETTERTK